jgi:hypothetical protein
MTHESLFLGALLLAGCAADDASNGDGDEGGDHPHNDYEGGQYRVSTFTMLGSDEGADWDDDGDVDNKLSFAIEQVSLFAPELGFTVESINQGLSEYIAADELIILLDCTNADGALTIDVLAGVSSGGTVSVDPASYDDGGQAINKLEGQLDGETSYDVGADTMTLQVPLAPGVDPSPMVMERVSMSGALDATSGSGTLVGLVPVTDLVAGLQDVIPPKYLSTAETLLSTYADEETSDGDPAMTSAFQLSAQAAAF